MNGSVGFGQEMEVKPSACPPSHFCKEKSDMMEMQQM
jgi:hypothetical protein